MRPASRRVTRRSRRTCRARMSCSPSGSPSIGGSPPSARTWSAGPRSARYPAAPATRVWARPRCMSLSRGVVAESARRWSTARCSKRIGAGCGRCRRRSSRRTGRVSGSITSQGSEPLRSANASRNRTESGVTRSSSNVVAVPLNWRDGPHDTEPVTSRRGHDGPRPTLTRDSPGRRRRRR